MKKAYILFLLLTSSFLLANKCLAYDNETDCNILLWEKVSSEELNAYVDAIGINSKGTIFVSTYGPNNFFRSSDNGISWVKLASFKNLRRVTCIRIAPDDTLYIIDGYNRVYISKDDGESFSHKESFSLSKWLRDIIFTKKNDIYIVTAKSSIHGSNDGGKSWQKDYIFLDRVEEIKSLYVHEDQSANEEYMIITTWGDGVFLSDDNGITWRNISPQKVHYIYSSIVTSNNTLIIGCDNGLYVSSDYGKTWDKKIDGIITDFAIADNGYIFAGSYACKSPDLGLGVFVSIDNGTNWKPCNKGLGDSSPSRLVLSPKKFLFAGIRYGDVRLGGGVYRASIEEMEEKRSNPNIK